MQRYFASINNDKVILSPDDLHHITHVMRMKVGDNFEVVIDGQLYTCSISSINPFEFDMKKEDSNSEIDTRITLFFALAKGDKIDLVIQKATELGVHKIVLFKSKRCVANFDNKDFNKKIARYNRITKEASEQCHRLLIPEIIGVIDLKDIPQYFEDINYVAYEKEAGDTSKSFILKENIKGVSIIIGSEGGLEKEEVDYLINKGAQSISLGKRILRCETAAIYSISVLSFLLEK